MSEQTQDPVPRAAIVTGASSGIGLAIARMLGRRGFGLTVAARRPEKLEAAADGLRAEGLDVLHVAGDLGDEATIAGVVAQHRERFGRLDVLVNNAGVGIGEPVDGLTDRKVQIQLQTNLASVFFFYRECTDLLKASAAEHGASYVINTASIAGKHGQPWLSVYGATKAAVINFSMAMHKELGPSGVKSTALCPGFVDTPMTDFVKGSVPADEMIAPEDLAILVGALLDMSPAAVVPEIQVIRPSDTA